MICKYIHNQTAENSSFGSFGSLDVGYPVAL